MTYVNARTRPSAASTDVRPEVRIVRSPVGSRMASAARKSRRLAVGMPVVPRAAGGASDTGQGAVGCERVNAPARRDADSKVSSRPAVTIGPVSRRGSAKTAGTPTSLAGWRPETDQRTTASSSRRRPLRSRAPRARARPAHLRPRRRAPARPRRSRAHHVRAARRRMHPRARPARREGLLKRVPPRPVALLVARGWVFRTSPAAPSAASAPPLLTSNPNTVATGSVSPSSPSASSSLRGSGGGCPACSGTSSTPSRPARSASSPTSCPSSSSAWPSTCSATRGGTSRPTA